VHAVDAPNDLSAPTALTGQTPTRLVGFLIAFLAAWLALDRLIGSQTPTPGSALLAFGAALAILAVAERLVFGARPGDLLVRLGFGRPVGRALAAAGLVSLAIVAGLLIAAAALGATLQLRPDWPIVLLAVLLFHGVAEELVWRGFAFAHLRQGRTFRRAVLLSVPLIALTHVPIVAGAGLAVGLVAMVIAAVTCLPLAHLWERGGRTIWAPALVHAAVDWFKLLEPTYPPAFPLAVAAVGLFAPLLALAFGDRFFGASGRNDARAYGMGDDRCRAGTASG
jgi:membrane protease YdiL (CAAX protease family)